MIQTLAFRNLTFRYDANPALLEDVTCELPSGENVLVEGPSGGGKSAFLKILVGLLSPTSGSYLVNGHDMSDMSFEEFLPYRKRIGYSFDFGGLLANRTLWDNLILPLQYHSELSAEVATVRVRDLVERFGLTENKDRRPAAVSGAMRKACVVARAFVMDPEMLILDDPFVGLDRATVNNLFALIHEQRHTKRLRHVFFTSRGEDYSSQLATRVLTVEFRGLKASQGEAVVGEEKLVRKVANR